MCAILHMQDKLFLKENLLILKTVLYYSFFQYLFGVPWDGKNVAPFNKYCIFINISYRL